MMPDCPLFLVFLVAGGCLALAAFFLMVLGIYRDHYRNDRKGGHAG